MDLGNPLKVAPYYLLIKEMISLRYQDEVSMVSTLVPTFTHWIKPAMSHGIKLSSSHDFTKLLDSIVFQPWENIEFVPKFVIALT